MNIFADGKRYENFLTAKVRSKISALAREFEFTATTNDWTDIPFYAGQKIEIWDDYDILINGYIERITIQSSPKGMIYSVAGRDVIGDLVDSNMPRIRRMAAPLPNICQFLLDFLGIPTSVVDTALTQARPFRTVIAPDPDENAGDFLVTLARRKRTILHSDGYGNIVIVDGGGIPVEPTLINRIDGEENNMISATLTIDQSQRFGRYSSEMQINMASKPNIGLNTPVEQIVAERFYLEDPSIRPTRFRTTAMDLNLGRDEGRERVKWEMALNRAEAISYKAVVPGFRDWEGRLWEVNQLPSVIDEFAGILDKRMLISQVEYELNADGKTTRLSLTDKDAFKAELKIRKDIEFDGRAAT